MSRPVNVDAELRHWLTIAVAMAVYSTVLYLCYRLKVAPLYAYAGLTFREPDLVNYGAALILTSLVAIILPRRIKKASDFMLWMPFLIAGAPSMLIPQYMDLLTPGEASVLGLAVAGCMMVARVGALFSPAIGPLRPAPGLAQPIWLVLIAFSIGNYAYLLATAGVPTAWIDLGGGYDVRADFAATTSGTLIGYLLPLQYNVINPIFIARGIYARRSMFIVSGFAGQMFIYFSEGQKSVLFSTLGLVGIAVLFRRGSRPNGCSLLLAGAGLAVVALSVDYLFDTYTWTSLFVRRFLVVPGVLTAAYVAVFDDRPKTNFADSFALWLQSPYDTVAPSLIVGKEFAGDPSTNANVNIFGGGFLSYGYLGMFIVAALFVLVLWLADAATEGLPIAAVALIFFMPTVVLSSASLFTALLTHGLAAAVVTSALLPRSGWERPAALEARQ